MGRCLVGTDLPPKNVPYGTLEERRWKIEREKALMPKKKPVDNPSAKPTKGNAKLGRMLPTICHPNLKNLKERERKRNNLRKSIDNEEKRDLHKILNEGKKLFIPHGLPSQIAKMNFRITYNDGICLRKICDHIKKEHWEYICQKQVEYRAKVWDWTHVERIPCGSLRENFVYAFNTYLPYKAFLPTATNGVTPW